jgi:tetratricopeptide (TPR) repeat protein
MRARVPQFFNRCLIYAGLALVTFFLYLPALHHGFVDYDDQQYVTDNPRVQAGLTWKGLAWAFGFYAGNWHPLAWLSHMLDCQLFGANAGGHHLTSVLLHIANTLLLFSVLNRMTAALWRSAAVAALFAWHPLHVESVAWVAERKDVLCAFFWMLTLWLYVRYAEKKSVALYFLTLGSFALCLMSKPMGVTLPFVLLLLDYWPLKRFEISDFRFSVFKKLLLEKIPFLVLSAAACALTLHAQEIAIVSTAGLSVPHRLAHVLTAYNHYLVAMFFPRHLAVYYPYQIHLPAVTIACAIAVLAAVTFFALKNFRSRPYLTVGWLWYLGTLVPVIGLVQVGDQAWADRYTYLPLVGLFIAVVWLASELVKNRVVLQMATAVVLAALIATTSVQLGYWKDTRTLFEHGNAVTPDNYLAITMLGSLLAKEHKYDEAIADYQTALRYEPTFPEAHFFLGAVLDEQGKLDEAIAEYQQALWFKPTQEQTHIFMGIVLGKQKKYDAAMAHYQAALKLNPDSAVAENNLARILHTLGRLDEAAEHYRAALEIDPKLALAQNNLGILLIQKGDLVAGTEHLRAALRLKPGNAETEFNLALALNQQAQWGEAANLFEKTAGQHADDARAHYEFAVALAHLKKTREAMGQYAAALLIKNDYAAALNGLAWILSTNPNPEFRDGTEAVKMAEQACDLTDRTNVAMLKTLSAAYAETGRFSDAIATLQTVTNIPGIKNPGETAGMLQTFGQARPWREE